MCSSPLELLTEPLLWKILILLPVKDITRLRYLSKFWNSLVLNPKFIKFHLDKSPKNTHMLISYEQHPVEPIKIYTIPCPINDLLHNPSSAIYSPNRYTHHFTVLGVCNGLVCLLKSICHDQFRELWVRLWSPATNTISNDSPHLRLSHNNHSYFGNFGFGYDASNDTYKVVLLDNDPQERNVKVHTLGVASWRSILTWPELPIMGIQGVSLGATVNWLAHSLESSNSQDIAIKDIVIFSYDLKEDTYRYLSLPDDLLMGFSYHRPEIQALKGCLCLSHEGETGFGVWLMMQFGIQESWTRVLNVSYDHLYHHGPEVVRCVPEILWLSKNNDAILLANYENLEFVHYNRTNNRMDRLGLLQEDFLYHSSFEYDESLVLPNRN